MITAERQPFERQQTHQPPFSLPKPGTSPNLSGVESIRKKVKKFRL
jgi:hypothetical protein